MSSAPQLHGVAPILLVADVVKAAAYYADSLGFSVPRMWGDPPNFCIPQRDGLEVMLNQVGPGQCIHPNAEYDGRFDAYFWVRDADALFAEFQARGADIVCEPEDQVYQMREFQVRDPDGHLLAFGHDLSGTAQA
jgi:catechol 2,3-dioxygenase-like lactoylglutathione lyase family enzyme